MRLLVTIDDETSAKTLGDALYAEGIATTVNTTREGQFAVWVHEEARMEDARAFLNDFNPRESRFSEMARQARAQKRQEAKEARDLQARTERMRSQLEARQTMRIGRVTLGLIIVSVLLYILTDQGQNIEVVGLFTLVPVKALGSNFHAMGDISALWKGQPWRIITPIFLHFNLLHILFNMWWLKDLGTAIERVFSPTYLVVFVLVTAAVSHLAQYYFIGPGIFGGMSGVVYGLFGFIWVRGRLDPSFPYRMPQGLVIFMLIWFALGFTGWVGPIANGVHGGGLVVGAGWGLLSSGYLKQMFR